MFENMNESQAKEKIFEMVKEYYNIYQKEEKAFSPGDSIRYAGRVYDENELINGVDSVLEFWLTAGRYTAELENALKEYLDVKYASLTNSGSSANLLAFMALTSHLIEEKRRVFPGDEIITVAAAFPTTVTPIIQFGAVPVFVDIKIPYYNIDVERLEEALSEKTKAVFIAHTLGNPFDLKTVKEFCDRHNLWLIEDNCDALGAEYTIDGVTKKTGTIGDIGTSSFYPAHHMTMGEGGAVYTNNPVLHRAVLSYRDWGRDCHCLGGHDNMCGHRYDGQYGELPKGYDHKYVYSHFGYNLKVTDIQAAIACAQIKKLPGFVKGRQENFAYLKEVLSDTTDKLYLPEVDENASASWFGFPVTVKEGVNRDKIVQALEGKKIQTRMLFSGNLVKHPCFDEMRASGKGYRVIGELTDTDRTLFDTFWVGVYPGMTKAMLDYMAKVMKEAID
ncbi:lipopolysaccharide biosynthesis protein RfbH [Sporofaciens musculi]|uniref:lipopolysaccharide biosynthesis protein RfbH n=1 Tax=Sporofaciens musculi TaxID=2681861 RepID=UPI002570517A|nr:lipopolysaccharide biosynthesis protein RfbH [Sporofaciens musculi]